MLYINKKIEELGSKNYQIFPLRNDSVYKHIMVDYACIVDMLGNKLIKLMKCDKTKSYVMLHPKEFQNIVFEMLFNIKNKVFRQKGYVYNYQFKTDGVSIILDFVNHKVNKYEKKDNVKTEDKKGKIKLTQKELFKKSKDDETFPELEKLSNKQIREINDNHIVVGVDPGKKSLLTMINNEGTVFQYNACQYRHETFHKFAHKIKEKERKNKGIDKIENELKNFNSKSMNSNKFLEFIHKKNEANNKVFDFYDVPTFRNINFREKQTEANLLNNIKNTFLRKENADKKITLGFGDWSRNTQMKNFFPTPNKWLRTLLFTKFNIVMIDEFKTSCICSKTEKEIEKHKYMIDKKLKECHKVLSIKNTNPKGETESRIFIDRDINGAKNILKIGKSWLQNKTRPSVFCRNKKS